jgi:hypothetical protein
VRAFTRLHLEMRCLDAFSTTSKMRFVFFFWQFVREHGCHSESELLQVVLHVFLSLLLPDVELS